MVKPISAEGYNLSIFGKGPKWTITCGKCRNTFKERLPMVDHPGIECPRCKEVNVIPIRVS
jgi:hypothetical protein